MLFAIPWIINSSDSIDNLSELNDQTISEFDSNICKFSLSEFLEKNINNSFVIKTDNASSIECFSKINGASLFTEEKIVYVGTNLNLDLIIQSIFWLVLFSLIPKNDNNKNISIKYKNSLILVTTVLIFLHLISENSFYSMNSKNFSTNFSENFQLYSLLITLIIFLKIFSRLIEDRLENLIYYLPFLFVIHGTFNSSNLNIIFICFMFIGLSGITNNNVYKIFFVINLILTYVWISFADNNFLFFDVDKLKGFSSSSYNQNSIFFWSTSFFFVIVGIIYLFKFSLQNVDLNKLKTKFLLSGALVVIFSIISALNPIINFFTYYYLGLNKSASRTFNSVAGNAWRGISSSAEAIGEYFAFVILFTILISAYKKNYNLKMLEIIYLILNFYGLYRSNNFSAIISMIVLVSLFFIVSKIKSNKIKYSFGILSILFFPVIYFSFFNAYDIQESSRKMIKEGFEISNIEYLQTNEFGMTAIDENRFYEIILNSNSQQKISTSLNFLVEEYHFSKRNGIPNLTTLISTVATPINRSEKWGIFFAKYNPNIETLIFGTGPINLTNYYLSHITKANTGLILPHSSIFSYLVFFGIGGLIILFGLTSSKLFKNRKNIYFLIINFYFLVNILKSDSLLYFSSFVLLIFAFHSDKIFNLIPENE